MAAAQERYQRVVQLGTQARSGDVLSSALEYVRNGHLGKVHFAKAWETARQRSIGHPADSSPPPGVDYDMWLGPAPKRPFNIRRFHGSWRWFFDYGTGDLGNDGSHRLDIGRALVEAAVGACGGTLPLFPTRVAANGGKFFFDDDQQWPDTLQVNYDYPNLLMGYEMRLWTADRLTGLTEGTAVYGDQGYITVSTRDWKAYDARRNKVAHFNSKKDHSEAHIANFLDCMRSRERPSADLATVGHPSCMLVHLGNVSWRAGCSLRFDPSTFTCHGEIDLTPFISRPQYRQPWTLPKIEDV